MCYIDNLIKMEVDSQCHLLASGIKLDKTFKVIKGIICDANATTVDATKAVSTCGQRWDGALFTVSNKVITLHNSEGEEVGTPVPIKGNCGVGLDGRFFHVEDGKVVLISSGS